MIRILTGLAFVLTPPLAVAQEASVAVGYTSMAGQIGNSDSDHGIAFRLGVDLIGRRHFTWSFDGGIDRLNEDHRQSTADCFLPGGSIGTCHFDSRSRDTGWSFGTIARVHPASSRVRPYLLFGLGLLHIREHLREVVTDDAGTVLPNFSIDGTFSDEALQGHLGGGVIVMPSGLPMGITVEGRTTRLFYNYSGGLQGSWNPVVMVGVRTRL